MIEIPQAALLARDLYARGATLRAIAAQTGLCHWAIYHWLDGGPKVDGVPRLPPLPRRRDIVRRRLLKGERIELIGRMMIAADTQVSEIETRLAEGGNASQRERDARTLAVLARTMRDLTALDALNEKKKPRKEAIPDDDPIPRDPDELRRALARRIEAFVANRTGGRVSGGPEGQVE
jgi:hypothetical protein